MAAGGFGRSGDARPALNGGVGLWVHAVNGPALLIAAYTVAALRPRRDALVCAGLLELAVVIGLLLFAGSGWWFDAIFASGMVAAAPGLGLYSATRRAYLAELRDRAERLERERDQQGALAAAAAERGRIAREMPDIAAHNLTVMVTLSDAAAAASAASPRAADREGAVPERPAPQPVASGVLELCRRHGHDGASGVAETVAAHLRADQAAQGAAAAGPDDQQVTRFTGGRDEHLARHVPPNLTLSLN